jgi:hypothetical protein
MSLDKFAFGTETGIALMVFGLVFGFFGRRLLKPFAFLLGFAGGVVASTFFPIEQTLLMMGIGGLIGGILTVAFSKLVVYGVVGALAAFIAYYGSLELDLATPIQYPITLASFAIGILIASLVPSFATIVITSGIGSYAISVGADCILKSGFNHTFAFGFGYSWEELRHGGVSMDELFGLMTLWVIMFMWMALRQLFSSRKTPRSTIKKSFEPNYRFKPEKPIEA